MALMPLLRFLWWEKWVPGLPRYRCCQTHLSDSKSTGVKEADVGRASAPSLVAGRLGDFSWHLLLEMYQNPDFQWMEGYLVCMFFMLDFMVLFL